MPGSGRGHAQPEDTGVRGRLSCAPDRPTATGHCQPAVAYHLAMATMTAMRPEVSPEEAGLDAGRLRGGELDGARLLSPRSVGLMAANHLPGGADIGTYGVPSLLTDRFAGRGFGLGLAPLVDPVAARSLSSVGEYTWGGAAGTAFWVDPAEELVVLFFTQVLGAPEDAHTDLRTLVYQALVG